MPGCGRTRAQERPAGGGGKGRTGGWVPAETAGPSSHTPVNPSPGPTAMDPGPRGWRGFWGGRGGPDLSHTRAPRPGSRGEGVLTPEEPSGLGDIHGEARHLLTRISVGDSALLTAACALSGKPAGTGAEDGSIVVAATRGQLAGIAGVK